MNTLELLNSLTEQLAGASEVDSPELEARWILERVLGMSSVEILSGAAIDLDKDQTDFIDKACKDRKTGRPLAYILGEKEFYGINFHVNQNVLIPRPESEHLVDQALSWLKTKNCEEPRVLDLGAGSGCIGLSVLVKTPGAKLCAVDTSVEALDVVDFNKKSLGLTEEVETLAFDVSTMCAEDLPNNFEGKADIILANPPYIDEASGDVQESVRSFEPDAALFADENGFGAIRRWAQVAAGLVATKGIVLFEIGFDQGAAAEKLFKSLKVFNKVELLKDYSGHDRIIKATRG